MPERRAGVMDTQNPYSLSWLLRLILVSNTVCSIRKTDSQENGHSWSEVAGKRCCETVTIVAQRSASHEHMD
jgi:hypothetical protein